ncbi:RNA ligase family protein [Herpetosiphon sp. NSE202]|uniref:RNA ligase family protein n=1 Tax=Herpetosiphon sp. NSE202 TaxID=3351349 RepID=UPI0036432072
MAQPLAEILLRNANYQAYNEIRVFTEFFAPNSFAGLHKTADPKELRLFDVWLEGYGFIGPQQFSADFASLNSARVVYEGTLTGQFFEDVRNGKFDVHEGVVCKGGTGGSDLWMIKIKTRQYQALLKLAFAERWEAYWE